MSKKYKVIALSVHSDFTQKVYKAQEIVSEAEFPNGHAEQLVKQGFLELHEAEKTGTPYDSWAKKDLNAELDNREIEHDEKATNAELIDLLLEDDAAA